MKLFSTPEFTREYQKLKKNNSYEYISKEIIREYIDKKMEDCINSGTRLNGNSPNPYIKKRLKGSGGLRLYLFALIKKDSIYLSFIHPKSGALGYENISNEKKASLLNDLADCIENNDLYELSCCEKRKLLIFNRVKKEIEV